MKLSLQDKINRSLALNLGELVQATGYGERALRRMNPPFREGKIRLSDFWKYHARLGSGVVKARIAKEAVASLEPLSGQQSGEDILRETRKMRVPQGASQPRAESPPHNNGL